MNESSSTPDANGAPKEAHVGFNPTRFMAESEQVAAALALLGSHGFKVSAAMEQYQDWVTICTRKPTADDIMYQLSTPEHINAHLVGHGSDERPPLSTRLVVGRAYSLTPGQRDVLRERYGLTPTRTVIVTNYATFEPVNPSVIRWVCIRSNHHVDDIRKHVLISATIGDFGTFLRVSRQRDEDRKSIAQGVGKTEDVMSEIKSTKFKIPKVVDLAKQYGLEV